jgi:hypothetical protein
MLEVISNEQVLTGIFLLFFPQDSRSTVDVARFVLNSILLLLTKPGPENIKCVCQTLKVRAL